MARIQVCNACSKYYLTPDNSPDECPHCNQETESITREEIASRDLFFGGWSTTKPEDNDNSHVTNKAQRT